MVILSLDSSTSVTSVACLSMEESPRLLFSTKTPHKRSDSSAVFEGLQTAITCCGHPDALCVGLGPGSYNGLRASIAASRALATALNIPLLSIPSPLGLTIPDKSTDFWAVGDARGGHYWIACVRDGTFLEKPHLLTPAETAARIATLPSIPVLGSTSLPGIAGLTLATPDAERLAILAKKADLCAFSSISPGHTPEPLYLKPPHITAPRAISVSS